MIFLSSMRHIHQLCVTTRMLLDIIEILPLPPPRRVQEPPHHVGVTPGGSRTSRKLLMCEIHLCLAQTACCVRNDGGSSESGALSFHLTYLTVGTKAQELEQSHMRLGVSLQWSPFRAVFARRGVHYLAAQLTAAAVGPRLPLKRAVNTCSGHVESQGADDRQVSASALQGPPHERGSLLLELACQMGCKCRPTAEIPQSV